MRNSSLLILVLVGLIGTLAYATTSHHHTNFAKKRTAATAKKTLHRQAGGNGEECPPEGCEPVCDFPCIYGWTDGGCDDPNAGCAPECCAPPERKVRPVAKATHRKKQAGGNGEECPPEGCEPVCDFPCIYGWTDGGCDDPNAGCAPECCAPPERKVRPVAKKTHRKKQAGGNGEECPPEGCEPVCDFPCIYGWTDGGCDDPEAGCAPECCEPGRRVRSKPISVLYAHRHQAAVKRRQGGGSGEECPPGGCPTCDDTCTPGLPVSICAEPNNGCPPGCCARRALRAIEVLYSNRFHQTMHSRKHIAPKH